MRLEQAQALTDDEIRVRVAEIVGWREMPWSELTNPREAREQKLFCRTNEDHRCEWLPNYPADLNACHEFERMMNGPESVSYGMLLSKLQLRDLITEPGDRYPKAATVHEWHATARQRCEAFVTVMGKDTP